MLIINNRNVWQTPVAKHCPITFLPLTTTIPNLPADAVVVVGPCDCPFGPSRGCSSSSTTHMRHHQQPAPRHDAYASPRPPTTFRRHVTAVEDPPTPCYRRRRAPTATSPPLTTAYATSPSQTIPKRHLTTTDHPQPPRQRRRTTPPRHKGCPSPP
jgi:hypothetical protein